MGVSDRTRFRWVLGPVVVALSSIPLWLIYSNPPLDLTPTVSQHELSSALQGANAIQLILDEHRKVVDEIKMHIQEENELFRYKFGLLGGLLVAFLVHIAYPRSDKNKGNADGPDERIVSLMNSSATSVVLAVAVAIAVIIDLHIRIATLATNQLALWICRYVEPALVGRPFLGYESYLREGESMNSSFAYGLLYWPPLHFFTWVIYVAYLLVLLNVSSQPGRRSALILPGFALVHSSLAAFALMGHTAPSKFQFIVQFELFGWKVSEPVPGLWCALLYLVPWGVLLVINGCYLILLRPKYAPATEKLAGEYREEFSDASPGNTPVAGTAGASRTFVKDNTSAILGLLRDTGKHFRKNASHIGHGA